MSETTLGIIGGGQLGSMLAIAAKKLNVETIIYCDDPDSPAQNFCNRFISAEYNDKGKIIEFVNLVQIKFKICPDIVKGVSITLATLNLSQP